MSVLIQWLNLIDMYCFLLLIQHIPDNNQLGSWQMTTSASMVTKTYQHEVSRSIRWCHGMETLSALPVFREGNYGESLVDSLHKVPGIRIFCVIWCQHEQAIVQTVCVISDFLTCIRRHSHDIAATNAFQSMIYYFMRFRVWMFALQKVP